MSKLTTPWMDTYRSLESKSQLVMRLGQIEHLSEPLLDEVCAGYCRYPQKLRQKDRLDKQCAKCPLTELREMIGEVEL